MRWSRGTLIKSVHVAVILTNASMLSSVSRGCDVLSMLAIGRLLSDELIDDHQDSVLLARRVCGMTGKMSRLEWNVWAG